MSFWSRYVHNRRRQRENLSEFRLDIAEPEQLGAGAAGVDTYAYTMKGPARLALSHDEATEEGDFVINGYTMPAAEAGQVVKGPTLEENEPVDIETSGTCPAGNFSVYVLDLDDKPYVVAEGEVA